MLIKDLILWKKNFFLIKLCEEKDILPSFKKHVYAKMRAKMSTSFSSHCQKDGTSKIHSYVAGSDDDKFVLTLKCVWSGQGDMAEFFNLNTSLYYLAGGCTKVSGLKHKKVAVKKKKEMTCDYEVRCNIFMIKVSKHNFETNIIMLLYNLCLLIS